MTNRAAASALLLLLSSAPGAAYSVLTHEAIIDSAWDTDIQPALRKRFPAASAADLIQAHAYAYGGCIIQDIGYYPFGNRLFSDLVHYVRSGDFVAALFRQAQTLQNYAFAFGAMAHYSSDINGHSIAVNRAVPIEYPRLEEEYGLVVTYADDPPAHLKTEFGFDVLQVARGRYAPQGYHNFIGFEVDEDLLDRALYDVYALHLKDIFRTESLAFGTYRWSVSRLIPSATRVAWQLKKKEIVREQPGMTRRKFLYNIRRASYEKEWGRDYRRPGFGTRLAAFVIRILPKVGPFRAVAFKPPTAETARLFEESFNRTLEMYRSLVRRETAGRLRLTDVNLDTGGPVVAGTYSLADKAYASLVRKLAERNFSGVPEAMRQNILEFYSRLSAPIATKDKAEEWNKTLAALNKLKASQ